MQALLADIFGMSSHDFAPLLLGIVFMGIPIVAMLLRHQQKMATILRSGVDNFTPTPQIEALMRDVELLKTTMNQQQIILDMLCNKQQELLERQPTETALRERL